MEKTHHDFICMKRELDRQNRKNLYCPTHGALKCTRCPCYITLH